MNTRRCTIWTALAIPTGLCLAFALPADRVAVAPEKGRELSKSFSVEVSLAVDDLVLLMGGNEMPVPLDQMELDFSYSLDVLDAYKEVEEGRIKELVRYYESVGFSYESPEDSGEESLDELEGKTVRFSWNDEDSGYDRAFEDGDDEEDLLKALAAELEMRAMLPEDEVTSGDSWEVALADLASIFAPGWDPKGAAAMSEEDGEVPAAMMDMWAEQFAEANMTCTYRGRREDGLGVIALSMEITPTLDLADAMMEVMAASGEDLGDTQIDDLSLDLEMTGDGELLWNFEQSRFESLELEGELLADLYGVVNMDNQGMIMDFEAEASMTTEYSISASAEEASE